jgi:preprotein translocase subunit SecF
MTMTNELIERAGRRHAFADVPLIVLAATLVLSLVVAFTAVSIGIARADTLVPFGGGGSGRFALAMLVGIVIAGMGGLTAALVHNDRFASRRD